LHWDLLCDPWFQKNQNGGFLFLKLVYSFRHKSQGRTFNPQILSWCINFTPPHHSHDNDHGNDDADRDCENRHFSC